MSYHEVMERVQQAAQPYIHIHIYIYIYTHMYKHLAVLISLKVVVIIGRKGVS